MGVSIESGAAKANRGWLNMLTRVALALTLLIAINAPRPAQAGWSSSLFDRISDVLITAGVDRDQIEMARFTIQYPAEAAIVYDRAAMNDYPFFALTGAAKAARGKSFGKLGIFTETSCNLPVTSIDTVFARASNKIDGHADGIAKTDAAMGVAADYGARAAKEASNQAKQTINDQMIESIPYFSDIHTICTFAFHTNFAAEHNIQQLVTGKVQEIKGVYDAFDGGDAVTGFYRIVKLGVDKKAACTLIDTGVSGGVIGRTPFLGDLAKNACAGFAGAIIDGVLGFVKGGVGIAEAGVSYVWEAGKEGFCAVASIFGSGCSSAPPPPTAQSEAKAWCANRGGGSLVTRSNAPNDYLLTCNDGSKCSVSPTEPLRCATAAELAANRKQRIEIAEGQFQSQLPKWKSDFSDRWRARCLNSDACLGAIFLITSSTVNQANALHQKAPEEDFLRVTYVLFGESERVAAETIEQYKYLVLPDRWAADFAPRWKAACSDDQCRTEADFAVNQTVTSVRKVRKNDPHATYGKATPWFIEAEKYSRTSIENSAKRAKGEASLGDVGVSQPGTTRPLSGTVTPGVVPTSGRTVPGATPHVTGPAASAPATRPAPTASPTTRAPISRGITPAAGSAPVATPATVPRTLPGRAAPQPTPSPTPTAAPTPSPRVLRRN